MGGLICGSMVGHFWTFLLKPPQPLMGLFFLFSHSKVSDANIGIIAKFV